LGRSKRKGLWWTKLISEFPKAHRGGTGERKLVGYITVRVKRVFRGTWKQERIHNGRSREGGSQSLAKRKLSREKNKPW